MNHPPTPPTPPTLTADRGPAGEHTEPTAAELAPRRQARPDRPDEMVQAAIDDFARVLPSHIKPDLFARVTIGALRKSAQGQGSKRKLWEAAQENPASLMAAVLDAARLGLEPGTKEYALTPRKEKGRNTVVGIIQYEGYVELMYRAGAVSSVKAELVHEYDHFRFNPSMTRPEHEPDWFTDRGPVKGAYAYAEMRDGGTSKVVMIGPREIERARESSAGANLPDSSWNPKSPDYPAMVLKTAIRQLQKWVPTSAEYRREQMRDAAEIARTAAEIQQPRPAPDKSWVKTHPIGDVDTVTGEIVDPPEGA